ncbi:PREDICTED: uncharacterized protein LOC106932167 isoform X2 [Poecilia mexicana]|uniref:uncharacterized protein LOC106932167 isoform X2 n=1 Tax=Poecilia mexicana TaxID=48701 RepID=UPI00072DE439|nr:PREDICTED: uncharacterized protein LOC106932167 isoform X2 [Poecilia mexicana]
MNEMLKVNKNTWCHVKADVGPFGSLPFKTNRVTDRTCEVLLQEMLQGTSSFRPKTTMKASASLSVVSVFLLCSSTVASQACDQFAAVGGNFTVPLGHRLRLPDILKWKLNGSVIFYRRTMRMVVGTNDDINQDGSLKLTNLQKDQAGLYTSEVLDRSGRLQTTRDTNLCVLDPVKKPEVKASCQDGNVIFHCVSGAPADVEHEWLQNGAKVKENRRWLETKAEETKGAEFVCKVSNKFSSETSEPVIHNCAETGYPDELAGINIWVLTGARVGFIVVLTVLVSVCFVRVEKKMTRGLKDEEELPFQRTDTEHRSRDPHFSPLQHHDLRS